MAASAASPNPAAKFTPNRNFEPETGVLVDIAPGIGRVTAPNRGPYTFTGTNSFLVGNANLFVIDPGPRSEAHLKALERAIAGRSVKAILVTHTHKDHSSLALALKALTGAPIWFEGPHRLSRPLARFEHNPIARSSDWALQPDRSLKDGETISVDAIDLEILKTPGHCANHLAFGVTSTPYIFTGDHVMGWSSTLVAPPDGAMGDYLSSLERLIESPFSCYLPAHGGPIAEGRQYGKSLLAHRRQRNGQIVEAIALRPLGIGALVKAIYPDIGIALRAAARMTVRAHVEYLEGQGAVRVRRTLFGDVVSLNSDLSG